MGRFMTKMIYVPMAVYIPSYSYFERSTAIDYYNCTFVNAHMSAFICNHAWFNSRCSSVMNYTSQRRREVKIQVANDSLYNPSQVRCKSNMRTTVKVI